MTRNLAGYLPDLLGPVVITGDGVVLTPRPTLEFVGGYDDPDNDRTVIPGGGTSSATTNTALAQTAVETTTGDATPTTIGATFDLPTDSLTTVDAQITCIQAGATKAKVFNIRRHLLNDGGSITASTQADVSGPDEIGGSLAATVAIAYTGTTGRTAVTGIAGLGLRWRLDRQTVRVTAAAAAAAPVLSSISPTHGDESTAVALTLTGTGFVTGCTVTVGGEAATGVSFVNSTSVTCTTPADLAAGTHDVVITNPDTQSSTLAAGYTADVPAFTMASVAWTGWIDGPAYVSGSSNFTPKASAGTSGSHTFTTSGTPVASTENGLASVLIDGVDDKIQYATGGQVADLVDDAAWTVVFVGRITSSPVDNADPYLNPSLGSSSDANWAIGISSANEVEAYQFVGGNKIAATTWGAGALVMIQARYNGTNVQVRKLKGAWAATTASANSTISGVFRMGCNYNGTQFMAMELCEYAITDTALSDGDLDSVADAMAARWGVTV